MPNLIETVLYLGVLLLLTPILGSYMAAVYTRTPLFVDRIFGPLETFSYKIAGIDPNEEMSWKTYGKNLLWFNIIGLCALIFVQMFQGILPLNPQNFPAPSWDLALNTAISFTTNTNWQAYAGETTLSYLSQMLGLTVQNFLSAATGMCALLVLIRGIVAQRQSTLGNFWFDLTRTLIYILLPLSFILAIVLVGEGVIQNFSSYQQVIGIEMGAQTIPMGPAASQVAIKELGSNGGGFFNTNSAHPFENPTALSNFLQMISILLIPSATVYMYGVMVNSRKQAWAILSVMFTIWCAGFAVAMMTTLVADPIADAAPLMEGIETRLGIRNTLLWSTSTTATSNGSVNGMLSSLPPLAGGVALMYIMLEEIIFGGVGVGLCGMIMFILLTAFLSGLMVGRTPEYLGKKIEKSDILWVVCATLVPGSLILIGAGISSVLPAGTSSIANPGPHGLTEILYAFSSASGNNGSAFAGLNANTVYYNLTLGFVMLMGRVVILLPSLALAGSLANKQAAPPSIGTLSTSTVLFGFLLSFVIFIVGALTFFPALSLGPILEHLLMLKNHPL